MSTENMIISKGIGKAEIIKGLTEKGWKILRKTAGSIILILGGVEAYSQANNGVGFVNNLPQMTPGQTLEIIIDGNGGGGLSVVQDNVEGMYNADLERWELISGVRTLTNQTSNGGVVTFLQGQKMIARGVEDTGNNPCGNTSGEDQFLGNDFGTGTIDKMVCVKSGILPVKLTHFIAACERDGQQVRLNRGTASEVNNKGFWVQKSADGNKWDNIAFVEGIGNTGAINNYSMIDTEGTEGDDDGVVYYKLEQKDFDGSTNYSDVVTLRDCQSDTGYAVSLSPNPVSDILTVSINTSDREQAQTIYIINMMGQVIGTVSAGDANKVQIDMNALPSGTYTIKTIAGNGTDIVTQQVVKI